MLTIIAYYLFAGLVAQSLTLRLAKSSTSVGDYLMSLPIWPVTVSYVIWALLRESFTNRTA